MILTNARTPFAAFNYAVQFRLLELLFDQPSEIEGQLSALVNAAQAAGGVEFGSLDPSEVAPFLSRYASPELGVVAISLRGDRLVLDAGELSSELRPRRPSGAGLTSYLFRPAAVALVGGQLQHAEFRDRRQPTPDALAHSRQPNWSRASLHLRVARTRRHTHAVIRQRSLKSE